jgi:multidrug efflux pump subunit AcrA (membrane-fusion protein)
MPINRLNVGQIFSSQNLSPSARKRMAVWILPLGLLLGFLLIFALLFRDRLIPAKEVDVFSAVGIEESIKNPTPKKSTNVAGKLMFQASGWIEPDPLPIKATALTDGIVDSVNVLQGELVKKGDLIATLIRVDSRLERDAMAAKLAEMKADFDAHCVKTQLALQRMEVEKAGLAIAEADAEEVNDKLRRYERLNKGAISEDDMLAIRLDQKRRLAEVDAAKAKIAGIAQELNQIAFEILAIQSKIKEAEIELEKAELAHARTEIKAPVDGRVLALKAAPGQKKMVGMDDEDSSTIAILYDPAHLQVRVDVPLADAAGLSVGQRAKIRSNLLPDQVFEGEVTRIEGAADLQRNTLQAKVRIENPSEKLRPEMLSRVEFFETTIPTTDAVVESTGIAVYVPKAAIQDNQVWICDPDTKRAERRAVNPGATKDGMVMVPEVRPGEWVVTKPLDLKIGQRLNPNFKERL